ncbi:MAG: pentapeptide repeat-containing protein [Spirosomataceae bacterium]
MKNFFLIAGLLVVALFSHAQGVIDAKKIVDQINSGQKAAYIEATISGDLDFTELATKRLVEKNSRWGGQNAYKSKVKVPLLFKNCRFTGNVLAYKVLSTDGSPRRILGFEVDGNNSEVYTADFEDEVIFENCTFEGETQFKYSDFDRQARFTDCRFSKAANFKYAHLNTNAYFTGSKFGGYADFKYTEFDDTVDFQKCTFAGYSDFKYTRFARVSDFNNSVFKGYADFKYTNFKEHANFNNISFQGHSDFKYARGR